MLSSLQNSISRTNGRELGNKLKKYTERDDSAHKDQGIDRFKPGIGLKIDS